MKRLIPILLLTFCAQILIGCTDDDFPRYLNTKELKNVRIMGAQLEKGFNFYAMIRNNNKRIDVYGIVVECKLTEGKDGIKDTILLSGVVAAGYEKRLKGSASYPMLKNCYVKTAKGNIL